jgi:large subunit ribosomal protein L5
MSRLSTLYKNEVAPQLQQDLKLNPMAVPKLVKITLNMGVGAAKNNKNILVQSKEELELITGQTVKITKARKSVAGFKIREGFPIGVMVTLRRAKMYEFFDRLISIALPRVRDFNGFAVKSFDAHGNLSIGIKEHIAFAEIDYDKVESIKGIDITIVTSTKCKMEAEALLRAFGFPFKDK